MSKVEINHKHECKNTGHSWDTISFIEAIKDIDPGAFHAWRDERNWILTGDCGFWLQVCIFEDFVTISFYGYGNCPTLIAKSPDELKQCCQIWWRHRRIITE